MKRILAVGDRQKRDAIGQDESRHYECAVLAEIDCDTGGAKLVHEYTSPPEVIPGEAPSIVFKSASQLGNTLYACTQTEVLIYKLPELEMVGSISLPRFNDVYHVRPRADGSLLVVSTGLDRVLHFDSEGRLNFVFELDGQIWVTRFEQRDAVCVEDLTQRIPIGIERPHDGTEWAVELYFTTVDGHLVMVDVTTRQVSRLYDLAALSHRDLPLGCVEEFTSSRRATCWWVSAASDPCAGSTTCAGWCTGSGGTRRDRYRRGSPATTSSAEPVSRSGSSNRWE